MYRTVNGAKLLARPNERKPCDAVSANDLPTYCRRAVVESTGRDDRLIICITTRSRSRISRHLLGIETIADGNLRNRLRRDAILIGSQTP